MNLAFLTPALLGGLAVLAVPLLIHLISKRRARRVRFAALELLLRSQKRTARSIRLRQILLLLMRTLLQQELLQRGVLTYKGFMLPSLAHRPADVEQTAAAFREALAHVQDVADNNSFVRALEIPLF